MQQRRIGSFVFPLMELYVSLLKSPPRPFSDVVRTHVCPSGLSSHVRDGVMTSPWPPARGRGVTRQCGGSAPGGAAGLGGQVPPLAGGLCALVAHRPARALSPGGRLCSQGLEGQPDRVLTEPAGDLLMKTHPRASLLFPP